MESVRSHGSLKRNSVRTAVSGQAGQNPRVSLNRSSFDGSLVSAGLVRVGRFLICSSRVGSAASVGSDLPFRWGPSDQLQ